MPVFYLGLHHEQLKGSSSLFAAQITLSNTHTGSEGVQAIPSDKTHSAGDAKGLQGTPGLGSGCWEGEGRYCNKD